MTVAFNDPITGLRSPTLIDAALLFSAVSSAKDKLTEDDEKAGLKIANVRSFLRHWSFVI
jgi:hypothetical protein